MANHQKVVLPAALPGILTGFILSLSRALGETAPLVVIGIPTILLATPSGLLNQFSALPTQIYTWAKMPQAEFKMWHQRNYRITCYLISNECNCDSFKK